MVVLSALGIGLIVVGVIGSALTMGREGPRF